MVSWVLETNSIATITETDEILVYNAGKYERNGEEIVKSILESSFGQTLNEKNKPILNQNVVSEILEKIRNRTRMPISAVNNRFDPDTNAPLLPLNNGILNLDTRELLPYSPKYIFLNKLPVYYDPAAKCPAYLEWRNEVLKPEFHLAIDEMMGVTLWPDYCIQKAFMLYGPPRAGKGTLIRILEAMIGRDNCSHVALQELATNKFKVANLYGKMLNTYGDLPETVVMDVGYFKSLTGEDTVEGEKKFKDAFSFVNTAKLVYSANKLPKLKIDDQAYYNRWIIFPFDNSFLHKEDTSLTNRLTTPEELSGILNLALEGLARLRGNNWKLSYTLDSAAMYRRSSNPVLAFLEDDCEPSNNEFVTKKELIEAYTAYTKKHHLPPPKSTIAFGKSTKFNTVIPVTEYNHDHYEGITRIHEEAWRGIRLKPANNPEPLPDHKEDKPTPTEVDNNMEVDGCPTKLTEDRPLPKSPEEILAVCKPFVQKQGDKINVRLFQDKLKIPVDEITRVLNANPDYRVTEEDWRRYEYIGDEA